MTCAGALLTGGRSRRMGTDKALLVVAGETLAERGARVLASVCHPVIEVGGGVSGLPAVREDPPGSGPLPSLIAAANALPADVSVLLLACDLPFVTEAALRLLADWPGDATVVPVVGDCPQYACARYGRAALRRGAQAWRAGESSLHAAIEERETVFVDESVWATLVPPRTFDDVDTPADMQRLGLS